MCFLGINALQQISDLLTYSASLVNRTTQQRSQWAFNKCNNIFKKTENVNFACQMTSEEQLNIYLSTVQTITLSYTASGLISK